MFGLFYNQGEISMTKKNLFQLERQFVDAIEQKQPLYEMTPKEVRQMLIDLQTDAADISGIVFQQAEVDVGQGHKMPALIILPENVADDLGVVYFIHGGSWVMNDISIYQHLIVSLVKEIPAALAVPLYSLSPERQFPFVLEDLYKGLLFIAEQGSNYGIDNKRLAVMGDGVGGNMATVLTFMAKENGFLPDIALQVLLYPVTEADFNTESYHIYADEPWFGRASMQWFWDMYLPDKDKRYYKEASPLRAFTNDLTCLPPALVITAENDVLRDEGEAYARKLDEAGVSVASVRFNGTLHDFMMLNALEKTPTTQAAFLLIVSQLQYFLYKKK